MTSWRHFVTLFHHANTTTIIKLRSATTEITETKMKSALEHICRLRRRQFVSWRHVVILVMSWRHVMSLRHHARTYTMIAWNPSTEISTEIHVYHHFWTSTSWYRRNQFCDVMTSCKHKNDNIFRLSDPENYRNKQKIISLALLQAEIEPVFDVMTWRHDMTSSCKYTTDNIFKLSNPKYHRNKKNHLSSTSSSWDRENKFGCVMPWRHDVTVSRGWVKSKSLNCILWMRPGAMKKWHFQLKRKFSHIK